MSVLGKLREKARVRAEYSCEYCGVSETDSGGLLTLDHVTPKASGGQDTDENLVYCGHACNEFKAAYHPKSPGAPSIWNPRIEPADVHFIELADGRLYPLTDIGSFTILRLRLNRTQLIAYRLKNRREYNEERTMIFYRNVLRTLEDLQGNQKTLLDDRKQLLEVLSRLIDLLQRQQR